MFQQAQYQILAAKVYTEVYKDDAMWAAASEAAPCDVLWINNAHDAAMISNECASKHSLLVLTPPKLLFSSSCVLLKKNRMQGLWLLVPCDGGRAKPQSFITITDCLVAFWHSLFESMFFKQVLLFCLCFPFWSVVCLLTFSRKSDFKLADSS